MRGPDRSGCYFAMVVELDMPDVAAVVGVAVVVGGTVPVIGVWCFFELEQPVTASALRATATTNTLIPREVMVRD